MKILMICTEKLPVPPVLGGAIQTYISGILPHLSKAHDITVLGINDPSLPDQETIDGNRYVRVPGKIFEVYREEVVSYLEANHFDLIHIFNRPRLVLPVRKAALIQKLPLACIMICLIQRKSIRKKQSSHRRSYEYCNCQ